MRAIRAWGDLKPNAILVISRILVLVDSTRPLERSCSLAARILGLCLTMLLCSDTNAGIRQRRAQLIHLSQGLDGSGVGHREDQPQALLQQVRAMQSGVRLRDPSELGLLVLGEVLPVLPQRIAGTLERLGVVTARPWRRVGPWASAAAFRLGAGQCPGVVPRFAARTSSSASVAQDTI